jgi:hypothetical protein
LAIIISLDLSDVLEIMDPPVLEIRPSSFAELGSAKQIIVVHIGRKPEHPIFPKTHIFLNLIRNLMLAAPNHLPLYFHP